MPPSPCPRCHAPLPTSGSGICAACSMGNLFGFDQQTPPDHLQSPLDLLDEKYELGELIGEGAFGHVYLARQFYPVEREVAIKALKAGTDPVRFEAEGQALASLDHPGIAKIYDSGIDDLGVPFLVMEFFPGEPVTAQRRSLEESLNLFIRICDAIQHAHQRGIIHRDLKPSNILVNKEGDFKIIDFGIAKATQQLLTKKTLLTELHQFMGTPGYVSPEQAGMKGRKIDTRSDIYSLGVLLHEMLTGTSPFDERLKEATHFAEILRIIQEEEIKRPRGIPSDLGWIILHALSKNPDDRYPSASEFSRDIQRFLNRQPIEARAPGRLLRVGKFISRNRAASVALLGLVAGFFLASYGLIRAREEAREAQIQAERASVVVTLINEMFSATDPALARDSTYTVRQLLDDHARGFTGKLDDQPEVELLLQRTLANAYQGLAEHKTAQEHLARVVQLGKQLAHPDLAIFEAELVRSLRWQGRYREALAKAQTITPSFQRDILVVELQRLLGKKEQSHRLAQELIKQANDPQSLTILALTFASVGDSSTARDLASTALNLSKQSLGNEGMHLIPLHQTLGDIAELAGDKTELVRHRERALSLAKTHLQADHPTRINAEARAAEVAPDPQKDDLKRLISLLLQRAGKNPETLKPLMKMGARLFADGRSGEAIDLLSDVLRIDYDHLSSGDSITFHMGGTLIGEIAKNGQIRDFLPLIEEAHAAARELFGNDGIHTVELKRILAYMYRWEDRFPEALATGREAYDLSRKRYGEAHGITMNCLINQIETLWDISRHADALALITSDLDGSRTAADTTSVIEKVADYYQAAHSLRISQPLYQQAYQNHLKQKPSTHPDCLRLATKLIACEKTNHWIRKQSRRDRFLSFFDSSLQANGITSAEPARIALFLTSDHGRFSGLQKAVTFLTKNLNLAKEAQAPKEVIKIYATELELRENQLKSSLKKIETLGEKLQQDQSPEDSEVARASLIDHAFKAGEVELATKHLRLIASPKSPDLLALVAHGYERNNLPEKAAEINDQLLPLALDDEAVPLPVRQKILQTAFRIHWDDDHPERYWESLDHFTDERADSKWPKAQTEILVPRNSHWFYHEPKTELHLDWAATRHDFENLWQRGAAPFSDFRFPENQRLTYRSSNRFPSTRFRHSFTLAPQHSYQKLKIRITYPGGFVLFLNGEKMITKDLPENADLDSYGLRNCLSRPLESKVIELPASKLKSGQNSLALQVHRKNDRSGLFFELQLEGLKR